MNSKDCSVAYYLFAYWKTIKMSLVGYEGRLLMIIRTLQCILVVAGILVSSTAWAEHEQEQESSSWQKEFHISDCNLLTTGRNQYFIMEPGYQLVLEGDDTTLHITVLDETRIVDGVVPRVIEEREWKDGELYEISRNYFAMCEQTKDVFYFGEGVDYYEDGEVVRHEGAWLAGEDDNRPGLIMAGTCRGIRPCGCAAAGAYGELLRKLACSQ